MQFWRRSIQWQLILGMGTALLVSILIVVGIYTLVVNRLAQSYLVEQALPSSIEATRNDIERILVQPLTAAKDIASNTMNGLGNLEPGEMLYYNIRMASRRRTSGAAAASPRAKDCSMASVGRVDSRRYRYSGPPAFGPVPDRPSPPNGWTPTTAPTMLRLT